MAAFLNRLRAWWNKDALATAEKRRVCRRWSVTSPRRTTKLAKRISRSLVDASRVERPTTSATPSHRATPLPRKEKGRPEAALLACNGFLEPTAPALEG